PQSADGGVRVVHARWFLSDRPRGPLWRHHFADSAKKPNDTCRELPTGGPFLCRDGNRAGPPIYATHTFCRSEPSSRGTGFSGDWNEFVRRHAVTSHRTQAFKPVRSGFVCWRVRGTEFRCLLVLSAIRRKTGNTRRHFFL